MSYTKTMSEDIKNNILKSSTSLVGLVCKDGVVLGADRRVTSGNLIMDKKYQKIFVEGNLIACKVD